MVEWIPSDVLLLPSPAEVEQSVVVRSELRKRALWKCVSNDVETFYANGLMPG